MRQILAMTRKEFLLWAQKPGRWLLVFVVPLIFIWLVYAVFGQRGTPTISIYAVNADNGDTGEQVMETISEFEGLEVEVLPSREEADRRVGAGERMAAVVVPENFTDTFGTADGAQIEVIIDPARAEQANMVTGLLNAALGPMMVDAEVSRGVGASVRQIMTNLRGTPTPQTPTATGQPGSGGAGSGAFGSDSPFPDVQNTPNPLLDPGTPTPEGADNPFGSGFASQATPTEGTPFAADDPFANRTPLPTTDGFGDPLNPGGSPDGLGGIMEPPDLELDPEEEQDPVQQFLITAFRAVVSNQVKETLEDPQIALREEAIGGQDLNKPSLLDSLVPGYSLMFVFFLISSLATTVVEEREAGTLRRLLLAPVPRSRILLGKMLPYFLIAIVQFLFIFLFSRFVFGIDLGRSPMALAMMIFASALVMAALGILIASFARSEGQADGIAIILILAMAIISGAMFPGIAIPGLQNLTPHYWAMQGFLDIFARNAGVQGILLPAGILLTMAAVFFTVGVVRFQFE